MYRILGRVWHFFQVLTGFFGVAAVLSLLLPLFYHVDPWFFVWRVRFFEFSAVLLIIREVVFLLRCTHWWDALRQRKLEWLLVLIWSLLLLLLQFPGWMMPNWGWQNWTWATGVVALTLVSLLAGFKDLVAKLSTTRLMKAELSSQKVYVISFVLPILIGTIVLHGPGAALEQLSWIDALFMATSAMCVTGLTVVSVGSMLSENGQWVVLILFQLGAIGTITLTMGFSTLFVKDFGLKQKLLVGQLLQIDRLSEVRGRLFAILAIVLGIELVGVLALYSWMEAPGGGRVGLFSALFHGISAFCNAGFSLYDQSLAYDAIRTDYYSLGTIALLIIVGGLGLPVIQDLAFLPRRLIRRVKPRQRLTFHSKIVLGTTMLLLLVGSGGLWALHQGSSLFGDQSGILPSLFYAVTARTAGFTIFDTGTLSAAALLWIMALMFVGGAPMSTAGGLKVTTLAVAVLHVLSRLRGTTPTLFNRSIPESTISRALSTITLSLAAVFMGTMLLSVFEAEMAPIELFFEAFSAWATVGLSTGITAELSTPSKLVVIALMFVGRVSMLIFLEAVFLKAQQFRKKVRYVEEQVII